MFKSMVQTDSSSSIRFPSFSRAGLVSDEQKYSGHTVGSRRSNFLKVCSWPFSRSEQESTSTVNNTGYDQSDEEDRAATITPRRKGRFQNPLVGINPSVENINQNNHSEKLLKTLTRKPHESSHRKRVVVLTNVDSSMGINSILQQVCGGPLEKVVQLNNGHIELYFIFPEHAKQFYTYGRATGLLMVNGQRLRVEWWMNENENVNYHPPISKPLLMEIIQHGCRRCLILAKEVRGKQLRSGDKMFYPEPTIHYSQDLNIEDVKADFGRFGKILDIGSVISRKLCFSIFYSDVRSAIFAMNEIETGGSDLNKKYRDWFIWYGKDVTDRACFVL
ncbi:uncharacterized protein SPAPADRAFT_149868 [Spathaspora passalidarum NRRL Y-27907]|uniref:RRM domain-containing protein n=1 Tax=Spathaspora passalidarum (strain NRRL Y-27907 / 11-Y1) TaxID=619300 RepID=G3AM30_SPAPN|nr:uncharacterized protein SPAPADRAFT_149868 [Spathaspora passalidarum NRRL Y-27907]EGW32735.1 hypothetical protein SPAPADRAFT_149868 [Spathaspora passalidarum NRRL Y-27907]